MLLLAIALSVAMMLAAAKAHGRQLRLERERAGYHEVEFGRSNGPFVDELWRRDRVGYWITVPVAAVLLAALTWRFGFAPTALAVLLWAPTVGFAHMGLASLWRQRDRTRASLAWWALVVALALAQALALPLV